MKFLFTLLLLALLGCGASQPAYDAALSQFSRAAPATRMAAIPPTITASAFLDWAERTFPAYFPSPAQSVALSGFVLRYYAGSLIYLGVRDDGAIYALGPVTENQVVALGTLADFACLAAGLNGGLFSSSNGDPIGKVAEFRAMALANRNGLGVAIMKFGYADIVADKLASAQSDYLAAVNALKAQGVRVLHVTPPLVYNAADENAPKLQMRTWMLTTFAQDTTFDLQDVESTDPNSGARCERGGAREICDAVRSTATCPSLNQGVDAPSGQGHLCFNPHAQRLAKAFLYAIYRAQL